MKKTLKQKALAIFTALLISVVAMGSLAACTPANSTARYECLQ